MGEAKATIDSKQRLLLRLLWGPKLDNDTYWGRHTVHIMFKTQPRSKFTRITFKDPTKHSELGFTRDVVNVHLYFLRKFYFQ